MKKLFVLLGAIFIVCSITAKKVTPIVVHKAIFVDGIYYNILSNGTAEVTNRTGGTSSGEGSYNREKQVGFLIPQSITYDGNTYAVTKIGDYAFYYSDNVYRVGMHDQITHIGRAAFAGCSRLTVILPSNLKEIGDYAYNHTNNSSITIPKSVEKIGNCAFLNCKYLEKVNFPESVKEVGCFVFAGTKITEPVYNSRIFAFMPNIYKYYDIPYGIEIIAGGAFSECEYLQRIALPPTLKIIETNAFAKNNSYGSSTVGCQNLKSIHIPDGVICIKECAFYKCGSLQDVTIGEKVEEIGNSCFSGCYSLYSVRLGRNIKYIRESAFSGCSNLTTINLPQGLVGIESYAFSRCNKLTSLNVPNSVCKIGDGAFRDIPYIIYSGPATGAPWGAKGIYQ